MGWFLAVLAFFLFLWIKYGRLTPCCLLCSRIFTFSGTVFCGQQPQVPYQDLLSSVQELPKRWIPAATAAGEVAETRGESTKNTVMMITGIAAIWGHPTPHTQVTVAAVPDVDSNFLLWGVVPDR